MRALADGADTRRRLRELAGLVTGRGACAHPDGTARLVGSLLTTLDDHVEAHLDHACGCSTASAPRRPGRRLGHPAPGGAAMSPRETVLKVDWPQCRARGLCAELFPEKIRVDEWGYPVVLGPVPPEEERLAKRGRRRPARGSALHLRTT